MVCLAIDEDGNVVDVKFKLAYLTNRDEFIDVASRMKFSPASKEDRPTATFVLTSAKSNIE